MTYDSFHEKEGVALRQKARIFTLGVDTGGYLSTLGDAARSVGHRVHSIVALRHEIRGGEATSTNDRLISALAKLLVRFGLARRLAGLLGSVWMAVVIISHGVRGDMLLINSPRNEHLPAMLSARVRGLFVVSVYHGSDLRPGYLNGHIFRTRPIAAVYKFCRAQARRVRRVERLSDGVIAWAKIGHFLRQPYIPMESIGFPINLSSYQTAQQPSRSTDQKISRYLIGHAPGVTKLESTQQISSAVEVLSAAGLDVELEVLPLSARDEVLRRLPDFDLVVDRLQADSSPGILAIECLMLGVPVLSAGISLKDVRNFSSLECVPEPTYVADLASLLSSLLRGGKLSELAGHQAATAAFLRAEWSAETVLARLINLMETGEGLPKISAPLGFAVGGFASSSETQLFLKDYLSTFGPQSLFIEKDTKIYWDLQHFAFGSKIKGEDGHFPNSEG